MFIKCQRKNILYVLRIIGSNNKDGLNVIIKVIFGNGSKYSLRLMKQFWKLFLSRSCHAFSKKNFLIFLTFYHILAGHSKQTHWRYREAEVYAVALPLSFLFMWWLWISMSFTSWLIFWRFSLYSFFLVVVIILLSAN